MVSATTVRRVADTSDHVWHLMEQRAAAMSPAEKADLVSVMTRDCSRLALAGLRSEFPDATDDELLFQLVCRRYGVKLAREAYPTNA